MTLEALSSGTKLVERSRFPASEDLEIQLSVGMVGVALETYDRLAEEVARG